MTSMTPDKLKALFEDLGKPTMRGVRKCPKCGTFNGTRGISCKNKNCDVVFKEKEKKRGHSAEAVKIITGSTVQVFSVRLRDRGPDYRGFVQLPLVQDLLGNPAESVDPAVLAQAARCYVDMCSRNTQIGVPHEPCVHIKSAINCSQEAQPLTLKNSVLNSLQVSNETKQAIWLLATETTGPLVQRVTRNIMVVKCKPNPKHPLGFLHFSFYETSRNRQAPEHKFQCTCRAFKSYKPGAVNCVKDDVSKRCVHFYACVCAFASDEKLAEEFSFYINLDSADTSGRLVTIFTSNTEDAEEEEFTVTPVEGTGVEEAVEDDDEAQLVTIYTPSEDATEQIAAVSGDATSIEVVIDDDGLLTATEPKRMKRDDTLVQASSALLTLQDSGNTPKKPSPTKHSTAKPTPTPKKVSGPVEEGAVSVSFHQWLSSVTERINQTMHYQFDGSPEPLVFHAPQVFFDCLQQRISAGNRKKRLPNSTTGFVRKDALPLGTFTKYTWHITNILHVKQIFDTSEMPLEITRSFVENRDSTFDPYTVPKVQVENLNEAYLKNQLPIRPFELKTYLKVGNTTPDQKEPTPFIIEWIPDILPKSHIGELRIKFEYGHQRNGQIEHRQSQSAAVAMQTITIQQ